jgi:hypothetical protein
MTGYWKDPVLKGKYVKRCKCGARPSHDRIAIGDGLHWIDCQCGKTGKSDWDLQVAIDNWNNDIIEFTQWMTDEKRDELWMKEDLKNSATK